MEGLEASILPLSEVLNENPTQRLDPEYFNKAAVAAFRTLSHQPQLRDFVEDGYRVVYENTKVIEREEGLAAGLPLFLRSADIDSPFINQERMACVSESEWERYPKGRIKAGELLIEVKGKAEKVAVVPDDFPSKTLVTGTCFKLTTKEQHQRSLLLVYLTGRYGSILKDRLKSNLLVSYIAKGDLFRIPVPSFGDEFIHRLHTYVEVSLTMRNRIRARQTEAEETLLAALGLADWEPPEPVSYTARASDAFAAGRLDAQYFMPAKEQVRQSLAVMPGNSLSKRVDSIRDMFVPSRMPAKMKVRNYDVTDALVSLLDAEKEASFAAEIGSVKKTFKDGDVVISRLRAYLKEIAVVRTSGDIPSVGSSEFIVLRPKMGQRDISPETLMVFLRSAPVQTVLKWCQDGSQHPRFSERHLLSIPVPEAVTTVSGKITTIVKEAFTARNKARWLLESAKRAVEIAIEDGEPDAMAFLDQADEAS